jgi:hypothetical protein
LKGNLGPETSYKFLYSVRHDTLWDAFVKYSPGAVDVTAGQFKPQFSLAGFAFADPAPSQETIRGIRIYEAHPGSPAANPTIGARDVGVTLGGDVSDERLSYTFGLLNGAGINAGDDNDATDVFARLVWSPLKGSESALSGLSLGGAYWTGDQPVDVPLGLGAKRDRASYFVRYSSEKLDARAEHVLQSRERTAGPDMDTSNWYVQASYKVRPELALVARFQQYDPDDDTSGDREDITTLGVNWYANERLTLRANFNWYDEEAGDFDNDEFMLQLDVKF